MDTARYVVALITIVTVPSAVIFWLLVHPNVRFWRRLGPAPSYTLLVALMIGVAIGMYRLREPILSVDFGTNYALVGLAAPIYVTAVWLSVRIRRHLTFGIFVGLPELSTRSGGGELLAEGVYARLRHPRYLAVLVGLTAAALFSNYLALYLLIPASVSSLYLVIRLEEKELLDRFGDDYAEYRERVPMFLPRRGSALE